MFVLRAALTCFFLVTACVALNERTILQHTEPVNHIKGKIVDPAGDPIFGVDIVVFTHPELWLDESLSTVQRRERQTEVATTTSDENGKFALKGLRKGAYELEFSRGGFNTLSVIVTVDSSAPSEKFCVVLSISSGGGEPSFSPCAKRGKKGAIEEERKGGSDASASLTELEGPRL